MSDNPRKSNGAAALAWMPLLVGAINSYGPIAFNYGFALYFLDYKHGFVKRGLVGGVFSRMAWMPHPVLVVIEYGFLAAAFGLTYLTFREILFGSPAERRLAAALLGAPALLPHIGYLFAQPDVTLYILLLGAFAALLWMRPNVGATASCALCCVALLAHEAFSLMFYPLILAMLLQLCVRSRLRWSAALAHIAIVGAVFAAVLHFGMLKVSPDIILGEAQARTNVGIQRQVYDVMVSSLQDQRALLRRMYGAYVWRVFGLTIAISLPYFILLGRLLFGSMRAVGSARWQRKFTGLVFLAPLSLCLLGHDISRWMAAIGIDATMFVFWIYLDEQRDSARRDSAPGAANTAGPAQTFLLRWAMGPNYVAWLIYLIAIGPFGATGIRSAEQLVQAWWGQ